MTAPKSTLTDAEIRSIIDANAPSQGEPWDMGAMLRAAFAKGYEAGSVPREPTEQMLYMAHKANAYTPIHECREIWIAMYDAAREGK